MIEINMYNILVLIVMLIVILIAGYFAFKKPSKQWLEYAKIEYQNKQEKEFLTQQKAKQRIISHELARAHREIYKIKTDLGLHVVLPLLVSVILFILGLVMLYFYKDRPEVSEMWLREHWYLFLPALIYIIPSYFEWLDRKWKLTLRYKKEIYQKDKNYPYYNGYEYGYIYTDYEVLVFIAKLFIIILKIINFLLIGVIAIGIIYWISTISPITIIIILLVLILLNFIK